MNGFPCVSPVRSEECGLRVTSAPRSRKRMTASESVVETRSPRATGSEAVAVAGTFVSLSLMEPAAVTVPAVGAAEANTATQRRALSNLIDIACIFEHNVQGLARYKGTIVAISPGRRPAAARFSLKNQPHPSDRDFGSDADAIPAAKFGGGGGGVGGGGSGLAGGGGGAGCRSAERPGGQRRVGSGSGASPVSLGSTNGAEGGGRPRRAGTVDGERGGTGGGERGRRPILLAQGRRQSGTSRSGRQVRGERSGT